MAQDKNTSPAMEYEIRPLTIKTLRKANQFLPMISKLTPGNGIPLRTSSTKDPGVVKARQACVAFNNASPRSDGLVARCMKAQETSEYAILLGKKRGKKA